MSELSYDDLINIVDTETDRIAPNGFDENGTDEIELWLISLGVSPEACAKLNEVDRDGAIGAGMILGHYLATNSEN